MSYLILAAGQADYLDANRVKAVSPFDFAKLKADYSLLYGNFLCLKNKLRFFTWVRIRFLGGVESPDRLRGYAGYSYIYWFIFSKKMAFAHCHFLTLTALMNNALQLGRK